MLVLGVINMIDIDIDLNKYDNEVRLQLSGKTKMTPRDIADQYNDLVSAQARIETLIEENYRLKRENRELIKRLKRWIRG